MLIQGAHADTGYRGSGFLVRPCKVYGGSCSWEVHHMFMQATWWPMPMLMQDTGGSMFGSICQRPPMESWTDEG